MPATRLVFLGPPGSGKGTQAQRLEQTYGLAALSSGDTLRQAIRAESAVGQKAAEFVQAGTLVPDEVITGVMLSAVEKLPSEPGFILDGFPRTVPQAQALEAGLAERGLKINAALDFRIADGEIIARIVARRVCSRCGSTYNLNSLPPQAAGVCDNCGGELEQRVDDREDVIATRLETYRSQTAPLVEYYSRRNLLRAVDAAVPAAQVQDQLERVIQSLDHEA